MRFSFWFYLLICYDILQLIQSVDDDGKTIGKITPRWSIDFPFYDPYANRLSTNDNQASPVPSDAASQSNHGWTKKQYRVNWRQAHHNTIGNWLFVIKWRCWIINSQEVVTPYIIIYINADYIVDLRYSSNDLMMTQWKYSGMTRYSADIKIVIILLKYSDRSASWQPTKERTFFESSWACGTELKNQWLNTHFIKINEWWKNKFDRINVR